LWVVHYVGDKRAKNKSPNEKTKILTYEKGGNQHILTNKMTDDQGGRSQTKRNNCLPEPRGTPVTGKWRSSCPNSTAEKKKIILKTRPDRK